MGVKEQVRGCFLGTAIGDALGMAVETFPRERIAAEYGRVTSYLEPKGHKWFDGEPAGMTTDDTALMLAVAEAMIEVPLDMAAQVEHHITALKLGTKGWGRSTKDSVRRLANGGDWKQSGSESGVGNGVAMKIAPVGLYLWKLGGELSLEDYRLASRSVMTFVANLSIMTHRTSMAVSSGMAMTSATMAAFGGGAVGKVMEGTLREHAINLIVEASKIGELFLPETLNDDRLTERLKSLREFEEYDTDRMVAEFGAGSCYVYNSLPFTLMHFFKNPESIDCLYDVVSAGGDTDSNGAMVGALLGAYHGEGVFPKELVDGLQDHNRILEVADRFYEKFWPSE